MPGQLIILPGVTAGATTQVERIEATAADLAALRIQGLKHVVSARALSNVAAGGVSGRCRKTGGLLTPMGTGASLLTVATLAGHKALTGISPYTQAAGLALPAGSATASYCAVFAALIGSVAKADTGTSMLLSSYRSAGTIRAYMARYRPASSAAINGVTSSGGYNTNSGPVAIPDASVPANTWGIYVVDFDDATKTARIASNTATPYDTETLADNHVIDEDSVVQIGYSLGTSGLRDCGVGDVYLFDRSMIGATATQSKIGTLIAALKTQYGIA